MDGEVAVAFSGFYGQELRYLRFVQPTSPTVYSLSAGTACAVHGLACWFDVLFNGTTMQRWLSTAPGQPTTHW